MAPSLPSSSDEATSNVSDAKILIVDDDPNVLSVVGRLLEAHGYEPQTFASPQELLDSVNKDDIGCVVTDLEMPGLSGIDVQEKLLAMDSCMSVIVITGHADVPRTIQIMSQGAVTLIEKPWKSAQLLDAIVKAVELSKEKSARRDRIESAQRKIAQLNEEEMDVMKLAAAGIPNKAISMQLELSPRTVDRRRQSALQKLEVVSVADFAVLHTTAQERWH